MKLTRRSFVASTAASALAVPLVLTGTRTEAAVPVVSPLLDAEKQRDQKRIILIEVFVKDGKVRDWMLDGSTRKLMEAFDADPAIIAKEADAKRERPNKSYKPQPEYPHAGIHVWRGRGDEVIFFSKQEIDFEVQIGTNPEFEPLRGAPRSPFTASVLRSRKGEAVSTGPTVTSALAIKQAYYKYTINVAGAEPLDPHIDLHDD